MNEELIGLEELCLILCGQTRKKQCFAYKLNDREVIQKCASLRKGEQVQKAQLSHTLSRVPEPEWFTERFGCTLAEAYKYRIELIEQIGGKES